MDIFGFALIFLGIIFIFIGIIGVFRFNNFYARILSAADVDTMGLMTILIGVCFIGGLSWFTLKVILILLLVLIINPIVTSSIVDSAFYSGYKLKEQKEDKDD